jgi:hypothetical protein
MYMDLFTHSQTTEAKGAVASNPMSPTMCCHPTGNIPVGFKENLNELSRIFYSYTFSYALEELLIHMNLMIFANTFCLGRDYG